jgi:hypothetical protein
MPSAKRREITVSFTIEQEQAAFDQQLPELLKVHAGKFVLFKDGQLVGVYATDEAAYAVGIKRFGPDAVFLVARVEKPRLNPVSYAWDAGVMFG